MPIAKAMGASALDSAKYMSGPVSSIQRLDRALKAGNTQQAKLALENVKQSLPMGQGSANKLAAAVTALDKALGSGDIAKATEAFTGLKEQAKKFEVDTVEKRRLEPIAPEAQRNASIQAVTPAAVGVLNIKA